MSNCLVTKLKESVDNNTLPKLNCMNLKLTLVRSAYPIKIAKPYYDSSNIITLSVADGNCYLADTAEAVSGVQSVDVKSAENDQTVYIHGSIGDTVILRVENYYKLFWLKLIDTNDITTIMITDLDINQLKYCPDLNSLNVKVPDNCNLDLGQIFARAIIFNGGKLIFRSSNPQAVNAPDIDSLTAFLTQDDAINALLYYQDKYSNRYFNGPIYIVSGIERKPFAELPEAQKSAIYNALKAPFSVVTTPGNLRGINFLGCIYTVSNDELYEDGVLVPNPEA